MLETNFFAGTGKIIENSLVCTRDREDGSFTNHMIAKNNSNKTLNNTGEFKTLTQND